MAKQNILCIVYLQTYLMSYSLLQVEIETELNFVVAGTML